MIVFFCFFKNNKVSDSLSSTAIFVPTEAGSASGHNWPHTSKTIKNCLTQAVDLAFDIRNTWRHTMMKRFDNNRALR